MHEISRLEALDLMVWIYFVIEKEAWSGICVYRSTAFTVYN